MPTDISLIRFKVLLNQNIPWWQRFAYLLPDVLKRHPEIAEDFAKTIQTKDSAFGQFVQKHVQAYLEKGTLPPATIVGPIVNIAEDVMAGREPVIRAGDYIAIQNQMRAH